MAYATMTNRATGYTVVEADWDILTNNFDALNTNNMVNLSIAAGIAPASGVTAAALELLESTGAGTAKPVLYRLLFDAATDEGRMWVFRVPKNYASTPKLVGSYHMASANTTDDVVLVAQVACVSDGDASHTAKVFAAANSLTQTVPDNAGTSDEFSITLTNADSMAANDWVCIILYRDANAAGDTAAGDLCLTSLALTYSLV